ncbi:MAG TPA: MFS transporter [Thermoanaerobaculia bacterium]|nr:MFS transporter [Thermoanaerobaculia bacterium]
MSDRRGRWFIPTLAAGLYFSQGLPFGIANYTLPLYLSVHGVSATEVGLLSTIGLAWTFKVFWAPAVDLYGSYRRWILGSLAVLAAATAAFGLVPAASTAFWIVAAVLALASATQDIGIDALTIRITPRDLLGPVNSARVAAYRIAIITAGGGLAVVSGAIGWRWTFFAAAILTLALMLFMLLVPQREAAAADRENPFRALRRWLARPQAAAFLAVIFLYRLGDSALTPMVPKFWAVSGFSAGEIGTVTTTFGMICTIAGAVAGGLFVARFGIWSGLLWLGILQMASNVGYAAVAQVGAGRPGMYTAAIVESFCNGLGTAAFLSFLMFICDRENAATEYAMLSAIFGLSRTLAGMFSGFGADILGWAPYFWVTVGLGIPGLMLLPLIRTALAGAKNSVPASAAG